MSFKFDLLGQLLGKARRRRAEQQARRTAQALLNAAKPQVTSLLLQAVEEIAGNPSVAGRDFAGEAKAAVAQALIAARKSGVVSDLAHTALLNAVNSGLAALKPSEALSPRTSLAVFLPLAQQIVTDAVQKAKL